MVKSGWNEIHIMRTPMSSDRFNAGVVSAMHKMEILDAVTEIKDLRVPPGNRLETLKVQNG
jgi:plasmid maintenance system killer protein